MKDINEGLEIYRSTPGAVLVDLRDPEDYKAGHIPGAISMRQETIREDMPRVAKFSTPIFLYDYNEKRADPAEAFLRSKGYTQSRSIGGIIFYTGEMDKPPLTIRELREKLGLTQAQFASELGISTMSVSSMETARMKVSTKLAARIREKYDETVISTDPDTVVKRGDRPDRKAPGDSIRELRDSLGLTREAFAKSLGLNAHTIYEYESGRIAPSKKALSKIKREYGVRIVREREKGKVKKVLNRMDVKEIRTALGLSQAELARELGIAPASVGHYENGRMNPSDAVIAKLKELYNRETRKKQDSAPQEAVPAPAEAVSSPAEPVAKPRRGRKPKAAPAASAPQAQPKVIFQLPSGQEWNLDDILRRIGPADTIRLNLEESRIYWARGEENGSIGLDQAPTYPPADQ